MLKWELRNLYKFNISVYNSNMKSSMRAIIYGEHNIHDFIQSFFTFKMIEKENKNGTPEFQ